MKTYIGTKVVRAEPLSRQEYNDLRNWHLPADENGADEGYLVEYTDGGKPNHHAFEGYISWSPKEQFELAYLPVPEGVQPIVLYVTQPALELVIGALRKLPHEQVHELVHDLWQQYQSQASRLAVAHVAEETGLTD